MLAMLENQQQALDLSRQHADEARGLADRLGDTIGTAHALSQLGQVARAQGAYEQSAALLEESLIVSRAAGDAMSIWRSAINLAGTDTALGNVDRATELIEEGQRIGRALGDTWGVANCHRLLGNIAYCQGDLDRAVTLLEAAIQQWRDIQTTRGPQGALCELGHVLVARGDSLRAAVCFEESMHLCQHASDRRGIVQCVEGMAAVDLATDDVISEGRLTRAAQLLGAATAQREALGTPLLPMERPVVEGAIAAARALLGKEAHAAAFAEGRDMPLDQSAKFALELGRQIQARASTSG